MVDALSIALSGLMAQSQRLDASASNIANAGTTGALPTPQSPATTVYKPLTVNYTALPNGGVESNVTADPNGYSPVYDPTSNYANSKGMVAAPNVSLSQEIVNIVMAKTLYKANVDVIKTQDSMTGDLLNTIT
ncbi:MAG: flagellar biosynthesis protein FlgC [Alphaproteobacteria bacterium]|nr:flagellar biosynthesis protein FlgC [Alphaproteobacteria bacterium]MDE2335716.1 flagellar biosynthesis protein FlgC [Alphaproteobacteria bacterium]